MMEALRRYPTVIIGLGGSGTKTVVRVKRKFERRFSDDHPLVQFLAFDTDAFQGGDNNLRLHDEFVHLANFNANQIVSNLDSWRDVKKWWRSDLRPGFVAQGAGGVRAVGRLALFAKFNDMRSAMERAVTRCYSSAVHLQREGRLDPDHLKKVRVYVIGSVCGGTGTGMLLDASLLIQHFVRNQTQAHPSVQGVFYLPSVFEQDIQNPDYIDHIQVNAAACLMDLEYMKEHGRLSARLDPAISYPDSNFAPLEQVTNPPFNSVFVVGRKMGVDAVVQMLPNQEEVFERAADMVMLELSSATGNQMQSVMDNFDQDYASFGVLRKELPERSVATAWCYLAVQDLLLRARSRPENPDQVKKEIRASMTALGDYAGRFEAPDLPTSLQDRVALQKRLRALEDCDSLADARRDLETLIDRTHTDVREAARGGITRPEEVATAAANELKSGLVAAFHRASGSLKVVEELLESYMNMLPEPQTHPDMEALRHQLEVDLKGGVMSNVPGTKKRKIESAINTVRRQLPKLLLQAYRAELWASGGNVARQRIQSEMEDFRHAFHELDSRLENIEEATARALDEYRDQYNEITHNAIPWEQVLKKFEVVREALRTGLFSRKDFAEEVLTAYVSATQDRALVERLRSHGALERSAAEQISNAYPRGLIDETDLETIFKEIQFTDALIQVDRAGPKGVTRTSYVGIDGGEKSSFVEKGQEKGYLRDYRIVDTMDRLSVDAAIVCHDFKLDEVAEIRQCRRKYSHKRNELFRSGNDSSLYLFHVLGSIPEIVEEGPQSPGSRLFSVAVALGWVEPRGQRYFYGVDDARTEGLLLDDEPDPLQRLHTSRERFASAGYPAKVRSQLESISPGELRTRIQAGLGERLEPMISAAQGQELKDELQEMRTQAEEYARGL